MLNILVGMRAHVTQRLVVVLLAVFVVLLVSLNNAVADQTLVAINGKTMGTTYHIKWLQQGDDAISADEVQQQVDKRLQEINQSMSTYIADSELSLFNQKPSGTEQQLSADLYELLVKAQQISEKSNAAYDVTVGPLINLWGFGPDKKVIKAPTAQAIKDIRQRVGFHYLELLPDNKVKKNANLYVDLSSIAKGYGVDEIAQLLQNLKIKNYLVEIGGEIVTKGSKVDNESWKIAIESPTAGRSVQRIVELSDVAVATSGDYRNYFEQNGVRYSHIVDPQTGRPISHNLASVTVVTDNCATSDALATAFLVMGVEKSYQYALENNIDAFFIVKNSSGFKEQMTPGFAKRVLN